MTTTREQIAAEIEAIAAQNCIDLEDCEWTDRPLEYRLLAVLEQVFAQKADIDAQYSHLKYLFYILHASTDAAPAPKSNNGMQPDERTNGDAH